MERESVEDIKKSQDNERIKRILSYLRDHIGEDLPVSRLAHVIPVSERGMLPAVPEMPGYQSHGIYPVASA